MTTDRISGGATPAAASDPGSSRRWRQRIAGWLFFVGGIVLLASLFLPWSSGSQVPGRDICLTCAPTVFNHTAWSLINPLAVYWGNIIDELTQGNISFLLPYIVAVFFQILAPLVFAALGLRLLIRPTPARLRWRALAIFYCIPELLLAWALLDITMWFSLVTLSPAYGFYLACASVVGLFLAGLFMPHAPRALSNGA
jgi:hypothetical protein